MATDHPADTLRDRGRAEDTRQDMEAAAVIPLVMAVVAAAIRPVMAVAAAALLRVTVPVEE